MDSMNVASFFRQMHKGICLTASPSNNHVHKSPRTRWLLLIAVAAMIPLVVAHHGAAPVLDTVWAGLSGPNYPVDGNGNSFNYRFQTAGLKHGKGASVLFVDGHSAITKPSTLTFGQFYGKFNPNDYCASASSGGHNAGDPVSKPDYDGAEWSSAPE